MTLTGAARRGARRSADHEVRGGRGADGDGPLVPVMLLVAVSVAVSVWLPAVLSVDDEGTGAAGQGACWPAAPPGASLLVKWTVPA